MLSAVAVSPTAYTASGNGSIQKYLHHQSQMKSLANNGGETIVSGTLVPENGCNLNCSYCIQDNRSKSLFLPFDKIQEIISALKSRGLQGLVISGGGEPTVYPEFNKLINWLKEQDLSLGLITNGTNNRCGGESINPETWDAFEWIRVSLNSIGNKLLRTVVPNKRDGKVGFSFIYTNQPESVLKQVAERGEEYNAKFVRILPDCNKSEEDRLESVKRLNKIIEGLNNEGKIVVQDKKHGSVKTPYCWVSKIKTFICPNPNKNGAVEVYTPCDSWMNCSDETGKKYGGIPPEKFDLAKGKGLKGYEDYLDGKHNYDFDPLKDCNGCAYTENNEFLDHYILLKKRYPDKSDSEIAQMLGIDLNDDVIDVNFV